MRRSRYLVMIIIGAIAGSGLGYWIGWNSVDRDTVAESDAKPASEAQRPKRPQPGPHAADSVAWMAKLSEAYQTRDRKAFGALQKDLQSWSIDDLSEAILKALELPNRRLGDEAVFLLIGNLAKKNPRVAFDLITDLKTPRDRSQWFYRIFNEWAVKDPAEAFAAILERRDVVRQHEVSTVLQSVFSRWFRSDSETAFERMKSLPEDERYHAVFALGSFAAKSETRERAFEMILSLDSEVDRGRALHTAVQRWAEMGDAENVLAWADAQGFAGKDMQAVDTAISSAMLGTDPKEASDWLMSRANDDNRAEYLAHAVTEWAQREPNACAKWLQQFEFGPETDRAVAAFVRMTMRDEPSSAFEWAREIRDPNLRSRSVERLLERWRDFEPEAAAAAEASLKNDG